LGSLLGRSFGAKRFVWSEALALLTAADELDKASLPRENLVKFLPEWKKEPDTLNLHVGIVTGFMGVLCRSRPVDRVG
jgi:hypothetical protein